MIKFDYKKALSGKVCRTNDGDFVIILADVTKNPYYKFQDDYPLFGIKFNNVASPYVMSWKYDGTNGRRDFWIKGILENDELERIGNIKLMYDAMENNLPIQWNDSQVEEPVKIKEMIG